MFDVDFVYSYIDGSEAKLIERRNELLKTSTGSSKTKHNVNSTTAMRWRAWGELEQSILATLRFAPWVRKIFVVSPNSVPEWFDKLASRQQIHDLSSSVNANDVKPNSTLSKTKVTQLVWILEKNITGQDALFNSHVSESCLHLIPDLAEHFVYLCDEMFMGRPVDRSLFFTDDGKPVLHVRFSERSVAQQFSGGLNGLNGVNGLNGLNANQLRRVLVVANSAYRKTPTSYLYAWEGALATANACLDILEHEFKIGPSHLNTTASRKQHLVHSVRSAAGTSLIRRPTAVFSEKTKHVSQFPRPELMHCCSPLLKQGFIDLWRHTKIGPILQRTKTSVFRKTSDVHTVYLVSIYLLMTQRATYYGFKHPTASIEKNVETSLKRPTMMYIELLHLPNSIKKLAQGTTDFYCLNDAHDLPVKACQHITTLIREQLPHSRP